MKRITITRPDTRVTDDAVAHLDNEVRSALPGWYVERDRAAHEHVMIYGRSDLPIFSGTLIEATTFVMGARAARFNIGDRPADIASDESAGAVPFVEEDTRYPENDDDPAHVAEGDRVRDPFSGTWRTVKRIDSDTAYMTDGGCMALDECRDIRLPGEALD